MEAHPFPGLCQEFCTVRAKLESIAVEQVLGSKVADICNDAAAQIALGGVALECCPFWQFSFGQGENHRK